VIRLFNAWFSGRTLMLELLEGLLLSLSFVAATLLWFRAETDLFLTYQHGFAKIALVAGVFMLSLYYLDLYEPIAFQNRRELFVRLLQALGVGILVLALLYYIYPNARLGREVFLSGVALLLPAFAFWRNLFFGTLRKLQTASRAAILGDSSLAMELAKAMHARPDMGITLLGYVEHSPVGRSSLPYLGTPDELPEIVRRKRLRQVIVAMGDRRDRLPVEQLLNLKTSGTIVRDGNDLYEAVTGKVPLESLRLSWLLFSPGFRVSKFTLTYKRIFSLLLGAVGLLVTLPLMFIIGFIIRIDSPGPIIFRQLRVGKDGKTFPLYKFRSMHDGMKADQTYQPAHAYDKRFTRVGRWLRRTRLDELPQLYNILRGDMHFIGPRPFVPEQEERFAADVPFYSYRWSVKPGATGWAQVNGGYCSTREDNIQKLAYDLFYIKNLSIGLDFLIMVKTLKILLLTRGAV